MYIIKEKKLKESELINYWDLVEKLGITKEAEAIGDIWIKWHNSNSRSAVDKIIKSKKYSEVCKVLLYKDQIKQVSNYMFKELSLDEYKKSLDEKITVWRGGSGKYNKDFSTDWVSFTANEKRVKTFSEYSGTNVSRAYSLDKNKHYWVIKLTVKLKDILAYYDVGDSEVIISSDLANKAKLIKQT